MNIDRELLELAAKAAGIDASWRPNVAEGGEWLAVADGNSWTEWNPLTDDGDALRLAVKLGLLVNVEPERVYVSGEIPSLAEPANGDPYAAARRAIVRAAAEIGKAMS